MTKSVKIAVSLPRGTYSHAEALRRRTKKSRSAFYAAALNAYLKAEEIRILEDQYEAGYREHPEDPKEVAFWSKLAAKALGPPEKW